MNSQHLAPKACAGDARADMNSTKIGNIPADLNLDLDLDLDFDLDLNHSLRGKQLQVSHL